MLDKITNIDSCIPEAWGKGSHTSAYHYYGMQARKIDENLLENRKRMLQICGFNTWIKSKNFE